MMSFTLDNHTAPHDWTALLHQAPRPNLLQSPCYAACLGKQYGYRIRHCVIRQDIKPAGLFQMAEKHIFGGLSNHIMLDRGPVWLDSYGSAADWHAFWKAFARSYPPGIFRRRRIIPELADSPQSRAMLASCGLKRTGISGYQTIWWDLRPETGHLRCHLDQKWRNCLNKSERQNFAFEIDEDGSHLPWLLKTHGAHRQQKNYPGPDTEFLRMLAHYARRDGALHMGRALLDGRPVSAILVIGHGRSATWQVGWTGPEGRQSCAGYFVLWNMAAYLKNKGYDWLDLGGVNDAGAAGVKHFKKGTGGEDFKNPGLFR